MSPLVDLAPGSGVALLVVIVGAFIYDMWTRHHDE